MNGQTQTAERAQKEPAGRLSVWRYDVPRVNVFSLRMPKDAAIYAVVRQYQTARILAMVNGALGYEERYFLALEWGKGLPTPAELEEEFAKPERGRVVKVKELRPVGAWTEMGDRALMTLLEIVVERAA